MDNQEAFDRTLNHMRQQGHRGGTLCEDRRTGETRFACQYRGERGRCAIGALLPDRMYRPSFEGLSIMSLIEQNCDVRGFFRGCDRQLLQDLQISHDHSDDRNFQKNMEERMFLVARKWGLRYDGPVGSTPAVEHKRREAIGQAPVYDVLYKDNYFTPVPVTPPTYYEDAIKQLCPMEKKLTFQEQFYQAYF